MPKANTTQHPTPATVNPDPNLPSHIAQNPDLNRPLSARTIKRALSSNVNSVRTAGVYACRNPYMFMELFYDWNSWTSSFNPYERLACLAQMKDPAGDAAQQIFVSLYDHTDENVRELAWRFYKGPVPAEIVDDLLCSFRNGDPIYEVIPACERLHIPKKMSEKWFKSERWYQMAPAIYARANQGISYEWLREGLMNGDEDVFEAAIHVAAQKHPAPSRFSGLVMGYPHWQVRKNALRIYAGRHDALPLFTAGLDDADDAVVLAAAQALKGADVPLDQINYWYKRSTPETWLAAMYASIGRADVPAGYIEDAFRMAHTPDVSNAAALAAMSRPELGPVRQIDIDPRERVYISCLGGDVAVGTIPATAHICADEVTSDFFTSAVKITDILGDFCGEKVGITDPHYTWAFRKGKLYQLASIDPWYGTGANRGIQVHLSEEDARNAF